MVVVLVAEPCATHSQGSFLSVHGHSPIRPPSAACAAAGGSRPADSAAGQAVSCETLSAGSQHSAHICLSLLTQARIPS